MQHGERCTCPNPACQLCCFAGYVRTDMTGWEGNIDVETCVEGGQAECAPSSCSGAPCS